MSEVKEPEMTRMKRIANELNGVKWSHNRDRYQDKHSGALLSSLLL